MADQRPIKKQVKNKSKIKKVKSRIKDSFGTYINNKLQWNRD